METQELLNALITLRGFVKSDYRFYGCGLCSAVVAAFLRSHITASERDLLSDFIDNNRPQRSRFYSDEYCLYCYWWPKAEWSIRIKWLTYQINRIRRKLR